MTNPAQRPRKATAASTRKKEPETESTISESKNDRRLEGSELRHAEDERRLGPAEKSDRLRSSSLASHCRCVKRGKPELSANR